MRRRVVISRAEMVKYLWPSYRGPLVGTGALAHEHCCLERLNDPTEDGAVFEWDDHLPPPKPNTDLPPIPDFDKRSLPAPPPVEPQPDRFFPAKGAAFVVAFAAIVGVLVWGLSGGAAAPSSAPSASSTPAPSPVAVNQQPLTQVGANAAAGALLVAWDDADHLQFVVWDINRMTGCHVLAVEYQGPTGSTDPRSIPDDVQPDVIGRAHRGGERITVWFGCERGTS